MPPLAPADELAMLRARIAHLQAREAALQRALLATDDVGRQGQWSRVEVVERRLRVFDHRLLPTPLRDDPLLWRERVCRDLRCRTLAPAPWMRATAQKGVALQ